MQGLETNLEQLEAEKTTLENRTKELRLRAELLGFAFCSLFCSLFFSFFSL